MLIEFSVTNFRSIRERQTLSLVASADSAHASRNVTSGPDKKSLRLLRSAAIYGPNAAGKSNFIRALEMLRRWVIASATPQPDWVLQVTPFLLSEAAAQQPTEFEIVFVARDGVRYHYYCAVRTQRVEKEWLVAYPRGRAQRWYEREQPRDAETATWWFGPNFSNKKGEHKVKEQTRPNTLFLSAGEQWNNQQLQPVFDWFERRLMVDTPSTQLNPFLSIERLDDASGKAALMQFMKAADVGIDRLELHEEDAALSGTIPQSPNAHFRRKFSLSRDGSSPIVDKKIRVSTWHKRIDAHSEIPFDLGDESDGTQRLFEFAGGWLRALEWGATLCVDELDRSLHPHICRFLIELFQGPENTRNAQLVFSTHDTSLLDLDVLRRDQVWFVEKDDRQSSRLYPLLDYSPRNTEALERGYLKGRYGAVPVLRSAGS